MIRNRYNNLIPAVQDKKKNKKKQKKNGKMDATKATAPQSKQHQDWAKRLVSFPKNG